MGTEREVKYQVLDQALFRRLSAMDHIGNFALEHAGAVDIVTIYLDSPTLDLYYGHHALRLRTMQGRVFLSLKGPASSADGKILGAALLCPEAYEVVNTIKLAMDLGAPYTVLRDQVFTHPTMSEALNDLFSL